jgi:hypothetical protein
MLIKYCLCCIDVCYIQRTFYTSACWEVCLYLFIFVWNFTCFQKESNVHSKKKFEDTKDGKSKDRQYHGNLKKDKRWSTKHYTETKDWETRPPEKPGLNSDAPER